MWSSERAEIIALDIYQRADRTGERITLGMCERRLTELAAHPDGHCGLCSAARRVTAVKVFWVASSWQSEVAATRRRAMRWPAAAWPLPHATRLLR